MENCQEPHEITENGEKSPKGINQTEQAFRTLVKLKQVSPSSLWV